VLAKSFFFRLSLISVSLLFGAAASARAATVVYDFRTPAAASTLAGKVSATYQAGGIPLQIQAGLLSQEGQFTRGASHAALTVTLVPPDRPGEVGLGVLSDEISLSYPEEGLSMHEGVFFQFSPRFHPTRLTLSGFTQGPDQFGGGAFEAVRIFVDGRFYKDVPGADGGIVTVALPGGASTLAITPLLQETQQIPDLSSDPVFFVAAIAGTSGAEVAFDIKPGSCPNPLNTHSNGVLPAAILGSAGIKVRNVDPGSIRLAGVRPQKTGFGDVAAPFWPLTGKTGPRSCNTSGPDGNQDLTLKFDTQAIVQALRSHFGTLRDGQAVVVPLEAKLLDGTPVNGEDVVVLQVPGAASRR
jgi:hypothetical protein